MSDIDPRLENMIVKELFGERPAAKAHFFLHGAKNEDATIAAGYPVYEDKVYVGIHIPDSPDYVSVPASEQHFQEYPQAYARFKQWQDWKQHNLELLPGITPAKTATLKELKIHTIEQLASHEGDLTPHVEDLRAIAKKFVLFMSGGKPRLRLIDGKLEEVA